MSAPVTPTDIQASQQALDVLQRVQHRVLLELWTTIMLVAGLVCVLLAQILLIVGWRRTAYIFLGVYGFAMTWVPALAAIWAGWAAVALALTGIIKESMTENPRAASNKA